MVEVIDFENTDEGELLNKIVKEVVEEYLKRKKIVFYVGEIEDVSLLSDDIKSHDFEEGDKAKCKK